MKKWISAFRLRTLPLAISSILMGNALAYGANNFRWSVFALAILTTVFLQVLSNLANDYGDSVHGADSDDRKGPSRAVQLGLISAAAMKRAMIVFAVLSLLSGTALLFLAFQDLWLEILIFLTIGIAAIYAAITYTAGSNPYGYAGLGDISVFLFFGLVGVLGSYFLQANSIEWQLILPAVSCGAFATGVLNVNNIRDIESDAKAGKKSIPVRIGHNKAVLYHGSLIFLGWVCILIYIFLDSFDWTKLLVLLALPLFLINLNAVRTKHQSADLDPYLKQLALSTLLFVVLFAISIFF